MMKKMSFEKGERTYQVADKWDGLASRQLDLWHAVNTGVEVIGSSGNRMAQLMTLGRGGEGSGVWKGGGGVV